jgi:hypothetical protein
MAETKGVKECLELLEGVKVVGVAVKKVLADGKVSVGDLPVLVEVLGKFSVLVDSVQGLDQVPAEFKDLSADEANQLLAKVLELITVIKSAA